MQINWPQLITNILGFLILFWGLKKFAWGPLLGMLDERREKIARGFQEVESRQEEARALRDDLDRQLREVDATARKRIEEAAEEGNRLAAEIKDDARRDAKAILDKTRADIDHELARARVQLREEIVSMAILGAEKVLRHELEGDGQDKLVNQFLEELERSNARSVTG